MLTLRKSLALLLAVVMVITFALSGVVLPAAAEGDTFKLEKDELFVAKPNSTSSDYRVYQAVRPLTLDGKVYTESLTWTVDNSGLLTMKDATQGVFYVAKAQEGTATVTATNAAGESHSCTVHVVFDGELISGGDFEAPAANKVSQWTTNIIKDGVCEVVLDEHDPANHVLKVPAGTKKSYYGFPVAVSTKYTISFDVKGDVASNVAPLYVYSTTANGDKKASGVNKDTWTRFSYTLTTGSSGLNAGRAIVYIRNSGSNDIYIDNVTMYRHGTATNIALDKTTLDLKLGEEATLTASPTAPESATMNRPVWTSDNELVASVDKNGKVTAKLPGSATITATSNGLTASCVVSVTSDVKAESIALDQSVLTLDLNGTAELAVSAFPAEAAFPEIEWSTSNESVATVENGVVTAVGDGVATISATAKGLDIAPAKCTVTVKLKNFFVNGDFENGNANWKSSTNVKEGVGKDGTWGLESVRPESNGPDNNGPGPYYGNSITGNLEPNTTYVLSFDYKNTGMGYGRLYFGNIADGFGVVQSGSYNNVGSKISNKTFYLPSGEVDWRRITYFFKTTDLIKGNAGWEIMFASRGQHGTTWFDNITFTKLPAMATSFTTVNDKVSLSVGSTAAVCLYAMPYGAAAPELTWTSADESVATVENGVVTGVGAGATTVTAESADFGTRYTFDVMVNSNIVLNGDFDQGKWVNWAGADCILDGVGKNNSVGMQIIRAESAAEGTVSGGTRFKNKILDRMKPDTKYILSFDYRNIGEGYGQIYFDKNFGKTEGGTTLEGGYNLKSGNVEWRTYSITFTTPSTISANEGYEFNLRAVGTVGETYYDNICIVEAVCTSIGNVYTDIDVENGELNFAPDYQESADSLKGVEGGTEVTVEVKAKDGYLMVPGSLKYTSTVTGQVTKILNKELTISSESFGSREFSGDTFTFVMPEAGAAVTAEFVPIETQNFAVDTVGTALRRVGADAYDGIRFLTRMNMAFSFNELVDAEETVLTLKHNGVDYTVKEIGSMIVRDNGMYDVKAMDPTNESTYWKKSVAYEIGKNMKLLDYTNRYIDFTVVVTKGANITAEEFAARRYTAQGYIILTDGENDIVVECGTALTNSVNEAKSKVA